MIQQTCSYSDEETACQIQENPFMQFFCGFPAYDDSRLPSGMSLMVCFREKLTPEILSDINKMIKQKNTDN